MHLLKLDKIRSKTIKACTVTQNSEHVVESNDSPLVMHLPPVRCTTKHSYITVLQSFSGHPTTPLV